MSQKRMFQVFDEMNVNDGLNKTATCACCFDHVEAKTAKGGGHVTMGVPAEAIIKIMHGEYKPVLILLDYKEYKRLEAIPLDDKLQAAEAKIERYEKALKDFANRLNEMCGQNGIITAGLHFIIDEMLTFELLTHKIGTDE